MINLELCPFCGGEAQLFANDGIMVVCKKCGNRTDAFFDRSTAYGSMISATEQVIKLWNARPCSTHAEVNDENT